MSLTYSFSQPWPEPEPDPVPDPVPVQEPDPVKPPVEEPKKPDDQKQTKSKGSCLPTLLCLLVVAGLGTGAFLHKEKIE